MNRLGIFMNLFMVEMLLCVFNVCGGFNLGEWRGSIVLVTIEMGYLKLDMVFPFQEKVNW